MPQCSPCSISTSTAVQNTTMQTLDLNMRVIASDFRAPPC